MCTWTGYIGYQEAYPILLEMGEKTEGIWSGFYSGIITGDENSFYSYKLTGDIKCLREKTRISDFKGNMGIFHSRTQSNGGSEWAHPFVNSEKNMAVIGQGHDGIFADKQKLVDMGNKLLDCGKSFTSFAQPCGRYPQLKNGKEVHSTEIIGQTVALNYESCGNHIEAIRKTLTQLPCESIFGFIFKDSPMCIYIGNINQRAVVGQDEFGTYMGTSTLAFPDRVKWLTEIPANTVAKITREEIVLSKLSQEKNFQVEEQFPPGMELAFISYVRKNPGCVLPEVVDNALKHLFPDKGLKKLAVGGYHTMECLIKSGKIFMETKRVNGLDKNSPAAQTYLFVKNS